MSKKNKCYSKGQFLLELIGFKHTLASTFLTLTRLSHENVVKEANLIFFFSLCASTSPHGAADRADEGGGKGKWDEEVG